MSETSRFIEWLCYRPTWDLIARSLATDYLNGLGIVSIQFVGANELSSKVVFGGFRRGLGEQALTQLSDDLPSPEGDSWINESSLSGTSSKWSSNSMWCLSPLRDQGIVKGYLIVGFNEPIDAARKREIALTISSYCTPIALYLSFQQNQEEPNLARSQAGFFSRDEDAGRLTQRQIMILRGMVEGKTNHEMADEMGFSVSTIRHETMRIYQALAVSDRREAAKKALMLSIV